MSEKNYSSNKDRLNSLKNLSEWSEYYNELNTFFLRKQVKKIQEIHDKKLVDKFFRDYDNSEVINNIE